MQPQTQDPAKDDLLKRKLSEYAMAEDKGVSLLSQMLTFTPTEEEHKFILDQVEDEKKHNRLFQERADELNVEEKFFLKSLDELYEIGQECVNEKDWLKCVSCQNIIEELAIASFSSIYTRADDKTREILNEIISDEKRHLDFTLWQIEKWATTPEKKKVVMDLQQRVIDLFLKALKPENLEREVPEEERDGFKKVLKNTYLIHRQRFSRLHMDIPKIPLKYLAQIGL